MKNHKSPLVNLSFSHQRRSISPRTVNFAAYHLATIYSHSKATEAMLTCAAAQHTEARKLANIKIGEELNDLASHKFLRKCCYQQNCWKHKHCNAEKHNAVSAGKHMYITTTVHLSLCATTLLWVKNYKCDCAVPRSRASLGAPLHTALGMHWANAHTHTHALHIQAAINGEMKCIKCAFICM